ACAKRIDKEFEKLLYKISCRCSSGGDERDDIRAIPVSGAFVRRSPVDGFGCVVVLGGVYKEGEAEWIGVRACVKELPAGECARDLLYVFLSVVRLAGDYIVDAHGEQFLKLSRKILVRN